METTEPAQRSKSPAQYSFDDDGAVSIHGSQSDSLGTLYWPPRLRCPRSGGTVSPALLSTTATLYSWSYVAMPWRGDVPPNGEADGYGVGLVDLDDGGPRMSVVLMGAAESFVIGETFEARELPFTTIDGNPQSILAFERSAS